jgi:hypothetical protein
LVVPLAARSVAAVVGAVLILVTGYSVIGTLIVPRSVPSKLTNVVDQGVNWIFRAAVKGIDEYRRRDRVFATQASAILICQLVAWLAFFYLGFALLLWPFISGGITNAFSTAGPGIWQIGAFDEHGAAQRAIIDFAAITGIVTITLQIAYLPTLYSEFNRRETDIALLNSRAGVPSWGPELLARTHYALGSGVSTIDTLPDLYSQWERWAADVAESHTTYLPLVRFRSPRPLSSWVTALLAVLDSAALILSLSPASAPVVPARLCLRGGFQCFTEVALAMGLKIPAKADPEQGISLRYEDFLTAVARLREVDFPIERDPADAWVDFVGWRVNYEPAAFAIAYALDVVPALWSGPRRYPAAPIAPIRPDPGRIGAKGAKQKQPLPGSGHPH